jgi:CheY-like chemotaxis protein
MPAQLRVLVVDDEIDSATSLMSLLQSLDCHATCAFGGDTGARIAQLFTPDLVFLDLEMPGSSGFEVIENIKGTCRPGMEPMFVCLTGSERPGVESRCWSAGFHRFVRKPMLHRELRTILGQARTRAAHIELNQRRSRAARAGLPGETSRSPA